MMKSYDLRSYYSGDFIDGFASIADWIIGLFDSPIGKEGQEALSTGLLAGQKYDSILSVGRDAAPLHNALLVGMMISSLILIVGLYMKLVKKVKVPIEKDIKSRFNVATAWLCALHIALFILTILVVIGFSVPMWTLHDNLDGVSQFKQLSEGIVTYEEKTLSTAQIDQLIEGAKETLKAELTKLPNNLLNLCKNESILSREDLIKEDQEKVNEALQLAKELLTYIQRIGEEEKLETESRLSANIIVVKMILNRIVDDLEELEKNLQEVVYAEYFNAVKALNQQKRAYKDKVKNMIEQIFGPSLSGLDEIARSIGNVKDSMNAAIEGMIKWFKAHLRRFSSFDTSVREKSELVKYILVQLLVSFAGLFGVIGLGVGLLALPIRLIYPPFLNYYPKLTLSIRCLLFLCFILLGISILGVFYVSGIALNWAASSKSICDSINNLNGQNNFYTGNFTLKDYEGKSQIYSVGDFLAEKRYTYSLGELIPNIVDNKQMEKVFEKIGEEDKKMSMVNRISLSDHSKLAHSFKNNLLILEEVEIYEALKSPFVELFVKEFRIFKKFISKLNLPSLKETFLTDDCTAKYSYPMKFGLIKLFNNSFLEYKARLQVELYDLFPLSNIYRDSLTNFCFEWRFAAAGMWLTSMLLGIVLMMDMIVIFKVSNRLYFEKYISFANEVYESPATLPVISSLLLEEKDIEAETYNIDYIEIEQYEPETMDQNSPIFMSQLEEKYEKEDEIEY